MYFSFKYQLILTCFMFDRIQTEILLFNSTRFFYKFLNIFYFKIAITSSSITLR